MAARQTCHLGLVLALVGFLTASAILFPAPTARAGTAVVFAEGFEDGTIGAQWTRYDNNTGSGLDYWDVSDYRKHTGNFSAWSAQVGTQSGTGLNNSDVHQYDDDMQADLVIDLQVNGFASLTLTFYYWSRAESGGGDFIQAWYEAGGLQFPIFTNTGAANWDLASVAVPTNVERLIVRFQTDASNHNFEGGYVDDIVLVGTENSPPSSTVLSLPAYASTIPLPVPYAAQDGANESGVAYVELWWRQGTSGAFALYSASGNSNWTSSPIPFDPAFAAGEGYHEFYTVAWDNAQNVEGAPTSADASVTIDVTTPSLSITAPVDGDWVATASVTVTWQGSDALSGIDRYETSVDGTAFTSNGAATSQTFASLAEGAHTVTVRAYDLAGNFEEDAVTFRVDTVAPTVSITSPGANTLFHVTTATVRWTGSDGGSGIDRYEVWVDSGSAATTSETQRVLANLADGTHTVHVRAVDAAGNTRETSVTFRVNTNIFSWDGPYGPFPLLLLIIVLLAAFLFAYFFWWRRREEEEEAAPSTPATTEEPAPEPTPEPPETEGDEPPPEEEEL